ncbi:hypothetical protein [Pseudonocardia sp. ICBG1293]|uniref:hypothetical protein n=1 Tax=Pseudonocardia sp. ICBG1293 TaxID=2844382 RepID=UPI001CC93A61|nr:hypothetical protein [Pseudonocardia sp. ICBG1293]
MEAFFLTCVVVAFFVTKGRTDTAAYSNGKEPPGLTRARMRHENAGGGARTSSGRPTGQGAFGLLVASRWTEACRAAQHRAEHRAARRRAWFDETAPSRDERWRTTQQRRLDRADRARARWAQARGLLPVAGSGSASGASSAIGTGSAGPAGAKSSEPWGRRRHATCPAAGASGGAVVATDDPGLPSPPVAEQVPVARPVPDEDGGVDLDDFPSTAPEAAPSSSPSGTAPAAESSPTATSTTTSSGGDGMYEAAVARLIAAADACGVYQTQLSAFTDRLSGDGWGDQVTGPLADSLSGLNAAEGLYRGLAEQMRAQGDRGRDAYDQAPYVPGPHAVL